MSTPAKKSGGWGSVFSNAVAGLESRLDTILAEDSDASAKARAAAAEEDAKKKTLPLATPASNERDSSRARPNDRLAERLARATAAKSMSRNQSPSKRAESPAPAAQTAVDNGNQNIEQKQEAPVEGKEEVDEQASTTGEHSPAPEISRIIEVQDHSVDTPPAPSPAHLPRLSVESSARPSIDIPLSEGSTRPSFDLPNGHSTRVASELEADLAQQREEMHIYLEKIDALQSKLTYLAQQTVAAAKEANATGKGSSPEARLAEKDERIALLMQEGEKLSKTELRHLQTIKKLRTKAAEDEKIATETKKKLEKTEQAEKDLKSKLRRAEVAERQASDKAKQIATIESQVEGLRVDRENASELVRSLTVQLKEAKEKSERVEREAREKGNEADKGRISALENDLEDAQIERKLAETRAEAESKKMREDAEALKQRFSVRELELKNEITVLETRVEAMRSRAEEASADGNVAGESSVKLLRQVETLQSQYALAKENWETIEGSLNARLIAIEKERDESNRRETEARKRAREVAVKMRKAEEEVEGLGEKNRNLEEELRKQGEQLTWLQTKLDRNENALADAKAESDRQRRVWESEMAHRIDEEKLKWQQRSASGSPQIPQQAQQPMLNRDMPLPHIRKTSYNTDLRRPGSRVASAQELMGITPNDSRPASRRSWVTSLSQLNQNPAPTSSPPMLSRQESAISLARTNSFPPPTPSIEIDAQPGPDDAFDMTETPVEMTNSPDRTLADLMSTSTAPAAGPSVQLVERMSALVRRLESEKATSRDEMQRLTLQRDSARDEIVSLMREVEAKRNAEAQMAKLQTDMTVLGERYDASLEMLGEREEEAEELRGDVRELKRLYRELVEEKLGDGKKG